MNTASFSGASVSMSLVSEMLSGAVRRGFSADKLLRAAGISPDPLDDRVPIRQYTLLYRRLNDLLEDEGFGLFSEALRPGSFELLCRSVISSNNILDVLQRAERLLPVLLPDLVLSVYRQGSIAELRISETRNLLQHNGEAGRTFAFEWFLRLIHSLLCWLAARAITLDRVIFPYKRPEHAEDYALIFSEHSIFAPTLSSGMGVLIATFHANLLDLPVRRDETALRGFLEGGPAKITTLYRRDRKMVSRIRELLYVALPNSLSLDDIAHSLHLSPRTIHRRLEGESSSFRWVKDALRRDKALEHLTKTTVSIAQIANDLGYADTSAFYRAVLGWTGVSPSAYRKRESG